MERFASILLGIAILYLFYALGIKNWDYDSAAKREELKNRLKNKGLSVRYYFIPARRLFVLNMLCGGLFLFYWSYKQWQAVRAGYKNSAGTGLKYGPVPRALFTFISFYQFNAVLNRTCAYMRKSPALAPVFWGTVLWAGAAAACTPALPLLWRTLGAFFFISAPCFLQRRINALPKDLPPSRLKISELLCLPFSWLVWAGIYGFLRMF